MAIQVRPQANEVPFSSLTTLQIGGPARSLIEVERPGELPALLRELASEPIFVLGGGSNLIVSDAGFPGTVLRLGNRDWQIQDESPERVLLRAGAGLEWDELVGLTVSHGWAGIECLSGIPGHVGAAPIQNIGAYGQEVAHSIHSVEVVERATGLAQRLPAAECGFAYRFSNFKGPWRDRFIVTAVCFSLTPGALARPAYADLVRAFPGRSEVSLGEMRMAVLEIRSSKSMVWNPADPNHRSAGSFFTNPIVEAALADRLGAENEGMPRYPSLPGHAKLSAAWLIERSGFARGYTRARVGLSSNHVLALINRGGATAKELLELAAEVRSGVHRRFGVELVPEPDMVGFSAPLSELMPLA